MFSLLPLLALVATAVARPPPAAALAAFKQFTGQQRPIGLVPVPDNNTRVPIVLGVMSRCPDALLCESVLDSAFDQTWNIINIDLSFVGKINDSDSDWGVTCMHGSQECQGNVQELCAINRSQSQEDWWQFVQCLNYEGKDQVGDKALAERCAGVASIPWDDEDGRKGMKGCVEGDEGKELLKASVRRSKDMGIEKSCTIVISGKKRCVRDGTWKECETGHTVEEFVSYIQDEYQRLDSQGSSD